VAQLAGGGEAGDAQRRLSREEMALREKERVRWALITEMAFCFPFLFFYEMALCFPEE
jgi:hypothetical protein